MKILDIQNITCVMGDPLPYFDMRVEMDFKEYQKLVELLETYNDKVQLKPEVKKEV
jgi:5,10-methylenetetrahydrofolate reductase